MKTMTLPLYKKFNKRTITSIECFRGLETELNLYEYNEKIATILLCEAPQWMRDMVNVNSHLFEDVIGAK